MANGIGHGHAHNHAHGVGQVGGNAHGGGASTRGPGSEFDRLLTETASRLGVEEGTLNVVMHEAEALYAPRADLTEDQKLAGMMDHIMQRLNLSDLSNEDMMLLAELCRLCLDEWEREAALEEGVIIERPSFSPLSLGMISGLSGLPGMPPPGLSGTPSMNRPPLDRNVAAMIAREIREAARRAADDER